MQIARKPLSVRLKESVSMPAHAGPVYAHQDRLVFTLRHTKEFRWSLKSLRSLENWVGWWPDTSRQ